MKRLIIIAALLLPALFACTNASEEGGEGATSVVLSRDRIDMKVGESVTLTATVLPKSLGMKVVWSVLDEEYAEVNDGTVTAKAEGVTYVVATSADGYQKAACMVSVDPYLAYSISIVDDQGKPLTGIYGYPGMSMVLSAVASDESEHSYTWSVVDPAAGSITSDGVLTLAAVPSASAAYVYDAQSYLKVVTEEGQGCRIPLRSSMLNGVCIGDDYTQSGTPAIVEKNEVYSIELLYEGVLAKTAIPADAINLELSNTDDFSLEKANGGYRLTTGPTTGVTSKLSVSLSGSSEKTQVAQLKIDKVYGIKAQFTDYSSSTLSFTWTEGVSADDDVSKPYTIYLYRDEDCTDLEVSFSIPAGDGCWKGKQPKFVFSGLTPATQYWFKAVETGATDKESALIPATTEAFNIVMVSDEPAAVGDIILAEDFGQFCWGPDEISQAAGYWVTDGEPGWDTNVGASYSSRDALSFAGTKGQYSGAGWYKQTGANKEAGFRLSHWAQGQVARVYMGPGYFFLSTKGYGAHVITPKLNNIPEGQSAKLKVTLHAAGYAEGNEAVVAVQHGISFNEITAGTTTNKDKLDLTSNKKTITYEGELTTLSEFVVTLEGVVNGDRIAFGPTTYTANSNSNMMILSDITVQIEELN